MSVGPFQLLIIVAVIILLFGAKRIPELARALGRASSEFKKAKNELEEESRKLTEAVDDSAGPAAPAATAPVVAGTDAEATKKEKKKAKKKAKKAAKKAARNGLPPEQA